MIAMAGTYEPRKGQDLAVDGFSCFRQSCKWMPVSLWLVEQPISVSDMRLNDGRRTIPVSFFAMNSIMRRWSTFEAGRHRAGGVTR